MPSNFQHPEPVLEYFRRVGAEVVNFRRALIKIHKGHYYLEKAIIRINADLSVTCSMKEYAPTEEEAKAMAEALKDVEFPRSVEAKPQQLPELERKVQGKEGHEALFIFYNRETGGIIMCQERRIIEGQKRYIAWTYFSDGEWMPLEPDGDLPFWKPSAPQLKYLDLGMTPGNKIMVHEGAKAAEFVTRKLCEGDWDHPWCKELAEYEHWGMIGGALAPHRTAYSELHKVAPSEVIYVCDNDKPGESALQKVSQHWGKSLKGLAVGKAFPGTWDLADPVPDHLFTRSGRYVGPLMRSLLTPATWATEVVPPPGGKGRSITKILPDFAEEWMHCVKPEVFVHQDWPNRILSASEFNNDVAPFSHVDDTARLLKKYFSSKATNLKYVPGAEPGIYSGGAEGRFINTYIKPAIEAEAGDAAPWHDFMAGLIPDETERHEVYRWVATLIARPDIKMLYGVLLISEMQGIGKGTLGEKILAPLVGELNVSYPTEQEIVESGFNGWLAHKRLAVVHEIYAGHSSKAYDKMKSVITDRYVEVNKKFQATYTIENWVHVMACSNSLRALKISMDDRRWYVPRLSEEKREPGYWDKFNTWLTFEGGLNKILHWAHEFVKVPGHVVERGASAPSSAAKQAMVEEAYSPGQLLVSRALTQIKQMIKEGQLPDTTFVVDSDLIKLIKNELYEGRHSDKLERPLTVRNVAKAQGWLVLDTPAQVRAWGQDRVGARVLTLNPKIAAMTPGELGGSDLPEDQRLVPFDPANVSAM